MTNDQFINFLNGDLGALRNHTKPAGAYNAGDLLDRMRPGAEVILEDIAKQFPHSIPTCPSQSLRAKRAIEIIEYHLNAPIISLGARLKYFRLIASLNFFLAVHQTVVAMERLDRNPDMNIWDLRF